MYEVNYKIYNHIGASKRRPFASVALHEAEDNTVTSGLYEAITAFHKNGIKDTFGISLKEYLEYPHEICLFLMELSSSEDIKKSAELRELEKQLNLGKKD